MDDLCDQPTDGTSDFSEQNRPAVPADIDLGVKPFQDLYTATTPTPFPLDVLDFPIFD